MSEATATKTLSCADCNVFNCASRKSEFPEFCLTTNTPEETIETARQGYLEGENQKIAHESTILATEYYGKANRLEEGIIFAKKMGFKKVGVASCVGLASEASKFVHAAQQNGLDIVSVACKVGGIDKSEIGFTDEEKSRGAGSYEAICNPILQAQILNDRGSEFNFIIGLCLGHDTLFIKHSNAPVTYLIVKDRALCHNPVLGVYNDANLRRLQDVTQLDQYKTRA
jgi:uncharacterized metal-binding protein